MLRPRLHGLSLFWTGVTFAIVFAAMRGVGMLFPIRFGYLVPAGFVLMVSLPFIFLDSHGRKATGFAKSKRRKFYFVALLAGVGAALFCYGLGVLLFGTSADNWFITIKRFYESNPAYQSQLPLLQLFLIFTIPAITFSPFGEEIFFRGFLDLSLREKFAAGPSKIVDSLTFGIVHVFHHGLILTNGGLKFYALSGIVWMFLMFGVAMLFTWLKERSQSIYPAVLSHATFNVVMNITIFYGL